MTKIPALEKNLLKQRLQAPSKPVSLVLDTDTYNEIDDQFAVAYAIRSPEDMTVEAIHAAPFHNNRSSGPADGMERSHDEIHRVLDRLGETRPTFKGSARFLSAPDIPVESPAANDLIARAMTRDKDDPPLYVVGIGAATNIASAILMEPRIVERIVVLWLGGHARDCHARNEFNLTQDPEAAAAVFNSGVPLVWFPCIPVASHLITTLAELERDLAGRSAIGDYLTDITRGYAKSHFAWGKVIWDIAPIGWLVQPDWFPSRVRSRPRLTKDLAWTDEPERHPIREVTYVDRNKVFADFFGKLAPR